jgi:hypothetical protein
MTHSLLLLLLLLPLLLLPLLLLLLLPALHNRFVDNSGLKITASLSLSTSLVLPPLGAAIRNATGNNTSQITVLAYGEPYAAAAAAAIHRWQQPPSLPQNTHSTVQQQHQQRFSCFQPLQMHVCLLFCVYARLLQTGGLM